MTREEAIKWFKESPFIHKDHVPFQMAIEALKQEPCEDAISRQAAIEAYGDWYVEEGTEEGFIGTVKQLLETLPSAQPELRWIPCSERLPEDYEDVLVWFEYFRYGDYNRLYQTHGIGDYSSEYDSWMINHETGWHKLRVVAWMPLPEPYKERRTDE